MSEQEKSSRLKKISVFCLKNLVNLIFFCAVVYYTFLAFVLEISPVQNKMMLILAGALWLVWIFAKVIVQLILAVVVCALLGYGWYYYANHEKINCQNSGGVWNSETNVCEEKVDVVQKVKDFVSDRTKKMFEIFNTDDDVKEEIEETKEEKSEEIKEDQKS